MTKYYTLLLFTLSSVVGFAQNKTRKSLEDSTQALQTVEIFGRKETTYKNDVSFIGSKSATALKDLPQSMSYVTKEIIADQGAFRLNEVVKNMSGVNQFSFYNDLTIRGHRVSGQENYSMLVNGMRTFTSFWKQVLVPHIERVEVLKGPASALFGNAAAGGTINRVTKKPLDEQRQSLSFSVGSFSTLRALADFTGPMNEKKNLLYRLNLGYENSGSFRDLQFDKNLVIAPSFSFLPSDKTRVNFDLVYQNTNTRLDRGQSVFGNGDLFSVPISRSLSSTNDYLKEETYNVTASLNHEFSKAVQFNVSYMKSGYSEDLLEHRTANSFAKDAKGTTIPTLVEMQVFMRKRTWNNDNLSSYFNVNFNLGRLENRMVIGYDYAQQQLAPGASQLTARGYRNVANTARITTFVPANARNYLLDAQGNPVPNVPHFDLAAANPYSLKDMSKYFFETATGFDPTFFSTQGFYVQNQIKVGKLQALLGFRQDSFTDLLNYYTPNETKVKQSAFIPRVGLVYSVSKNINAYATWVQGYQPQSAAQINNPNAGGPFNPLISELLEGGLKTEWFDKRFTATMSVYNLKVQGALYNANEAGNPEKLVQVGQEVSKGVEFDLLGQIAQNWSFLATYAYNDAQITQALLATDVNLNRQKPNAPKQQGSFWTKYVISSGNLRGLGVGLGGNFVTERNVSLNTAQTLPAYGLANAAVYYQDQKFKVQININNLTNKTHWVGGYDYIRLFPGAPRNWLATIAYTF